MRLAAALPTLLEPFALAAFVCGGLRPGDLTLRHRGFAVWFDLGLFFDVGLVDRFLRRFGHRFVDPLTEHAHPMFAMQHV